MFSQSDVSAGLQIDLNILKEGQDWNRQLLPILQYPKASPDIGRPNTGAGVKRGIGRIRRPINGKEMVINRSVGRPWEEGETLSRLHQEHDSDASGSP